MMFGSKNRSMEEYEMVDQGARLDESGVNSESRRSESEARSSTDSQISDIFEQIDVRLDGDKHEREDFTSDFTFQLTSSSLSADGKRRKHILWSTGGLFLFLWSVGLIVYSRKSPYELISQFQWQTSVEMSGKNVTLNRYAPQYQNLTLDNFRRGIYLPSREDITWLNRQQYPEGKGGGFYLSPQGRNSIVVRNFKSDFSQPLFTNPQFTYEDNFFYAKEVILNPSSSFDSSGTWHLIKTDIEDKWRDSTSALYWVCRIRSLDCTPLQPPEDRRVRGESQRDVSSELQRLNFAEFSPDGNSIVFSFANDLFLKSLESGELTQLTFDGSESIFNGLPDWVYEEEVIGDYKMVWWSPESSNLIFAKLNDSEVADYILDYVVDETGSSDIQQYPRIRKIKYPKPGTPNPRVALYDYDLKSKETKRISLKDSKFGDDAIIYQTGWIDNNNFLIFQTDRTSRLLSKFAYDPRDSSSSGQLVTSVNVTEEYDGWIEKIPVITTIPTEGDSDNMYIDRVVHNDNLHLALFKNAKDPDYTLLTESAEWGIRSDSPVVYDKLENRIYALTTARGSMDSHLVSIDTKDPKNAIFITSTEKDGKFEVTFSPDGQYLNLIYTGPDLPWQKLLDMQEIHDYVKENGVKDESGVDELIAQKHPINFYELTQNTFSKINLPTKLYKTIELRQPKGAKAIKLNVIEILPPNFDPKKKKYPILVNVYGGPGSQTVDKSFSVSFETIVSSNLDAIILIVDPRGTGEQGWSYKAFAKDKIGYWEPRDISTVVSEYIAVNNKFVDPQRVAIWGWSYGGFSTLKTLEFDKGQTFKYGVAVAPVTDFMFYDSIYTERYMRTPSENPNYKETSILTNFDSFKSVKRFFVLHGTSDDNVHLQNSLWLLDKLDVNSVENYDVHIFPDNDHSISFHNADTIIYDKILGWLRAAFNGGFDDYYT